MHAICIFIIVVLLIALIAVSVFKATPETQKVYLTSHGAPRHSGSDLTNDHTSALEDVGIQM